MLFTISAFDVRIVDQTEQTEQYEIMRYLFKLLKAWSLQLVFTFKSVLNLQMTYIIIAHIYEQWDR